MTNDTKRPTDFTGFGLHKKLLFGLEKNSFTTPTPIQAEGIIPQMQGHDLMGLAQTGTGKTAAFGLPLLHELIENDVRPTPRKCRALILCPTRELAVQIEETLRKLSGGARLSMLLVLGGVPRNRQIRALARGVDVLIATPGRLIDLMNERHVDFDETSTLILDEADRMLDMGFVKPVQRIAARLHPRHRTALFSATMPKEVEGLAAELLNDPIRIEVAPPGETVTKINQSVELMSHDDKRARLAEIVSGEGVGRVIVFARTKRGADRVSKNLEKDGIKSDAIHGDKAQNARQRALKGFASGAVRVLVATDIAARGIDVKDITHVVQYELPDEPEAYVHRIGRTGRNGAEGTAIALCCPDERDKLRAIEKLTRLRLTPEGAEPAPRKGGAKKPARRGPPDRRRENRPPRDREDRAPRSNRPHSGGRPNRNAEAAGPREEGEGRSSEQRSFKGKPRHSDQARPDRDRSERSERSRPSHNRSDQGRSDQGRSDQGRDRKRPEQGGGRDGEERRQNDHRPAKGKPRRPAHAGGRHDGEKRSGEGRPPASAKPRHSRPEGDHSSKPNRGPRAEGERPAKQKPRGPGRADKRGGDAVPRRAAKRPVRAGAPNRSGGK